jgi:hypothetical protein
MQSPYDRTAAFLRALYRRDPVVFCAIAFAAVWTAWTIYEFATGRMADLGWFLRTREAIGEIGSGLIIAAGVIWISDLLRRSATRR